MFGICSFGDCKRMRGKRAQKRMIEGDVLYNNRVVHKLINTLMEDGKKSVAQSIVYKSFEKIEKESDEEALRVFEKALENVKPAMEVRPRRVGGASYQVPMEVRGERKISLALRWIIEAARKRNSSTYKTMINKLAAEVVDASKGEGEAVKKKENMLRMAEANRAFAHFRW